MSVSRSSGVGVRCPTKSEILSPFVPETVGPDTRGEECGSSQRLVTRRPPEEEGEGDVTQVSPVVVGVHSPQSRKRSPPDRLTHVGLPDTTLVGYQKRTGYPVPVSFVSRSR